MADSKISGLTAATTAAAADQVALVQGGVSKSATLSVLRAGFIGAGLSNVSTATVSAGYAADTYLAGSAITIPVAGGWQAGTIYRCDFDMVKTAAGTATPIIVIRMGTLGTTGDTGILSFTFAAGTAAADTGQFTVEAVFRSVGSGTSAVLAGYVTCSHLLAATGLVSTGASGFGMLTNAISAGFNSTTQTIIGCSFNGGASFSGTNYLVQAYALKA